MGRGKKVFITGGSGGIGRAVVHLFADENFDVHFTYRSNKSEAEKLNSDNITAHYWDASDRESLENLRGVLGDVDILINNAGLGSATVAKITEDVLEQDMMMMKVNSVAPLWMIRAVLPGMKKRNFGKIINIASVGGGITQFPGFSLSDGMSKAALTFLTRQLAAELSHDEIDVFAVCPGATETPMFEASTLSKLDEAARKELEKKLPGGRLIDPEEIARISLYLCRNEARVLRGSILDASFGLGSNPGLLQK